MKNYAALSVLAYFAAACDHLTAETSDEFNDDEKKGLDFDSAVVDL